jgi:MATE family multidrug resistance protein
MEAVGKSGSTRREIWSLTWPQMLMLCLNFVIGFVDVWVAGRIDGRLQACLGIITQSMFLFLVIATSVASGAVAAVTQSLGAGERLRADRYAVFCLTIAAVSGVALLAACLPFRGAILSALQVPESIAPLTRYVLLVYLLTMPSYYMMLMQGAIFRAQGRVMVPLYTVIVVAGLNTLGDFGFGLGLWGLPDLGVSGVVWSTFVSVSAGAAFGFAVLWRGGLFVRRNFAPWKWVRRSFPYLLKVALPSGAISILWQLGYLVLFAIAASLPEGSVKALGGLAVGARVEAFLLLPGYAFNLTAGIVVGRMIGAGRMDEARRTGLRILFLGLLFIGLVMVCVWPFIGDIAAFMAPDAGVRAEAESYLFYNVLALPFTVATLVLSGLLAGAGATLLILVGVGGGTWLVRLPLAYLLGHVILGSSTGIWMSMLVSQACQAAILLWMFSRVDLGRYAMKQSRNQAS